MDKIKTLISNLGILIFSFLLISCSPQQSVNEFQANDSVSSEQKITKQGDEDNWYGKVTNWFGGLVNDSNELKKAAENGDAKAQYELGVMYYWGDGGVPQDVEKSTYWFRKAAEQGDAWAQFKLGGMHYHGWGVPINFKKATYWYEKAAKQGHAEAEIMLLKAQSQL